MRYACLGTQIVNDIHFADVSEKRGIMGGTIFARYEEGKLVIELKFIK